MYNCFQGRIPAIKNAYRYDKPQFSRAHASACKGLVEVCEQRYDISIYNILNAFNTISLYVHLIKDVTGWNDVCTTTKLLCQILIGRWKYSIVSY